MVDQYMRTGSVHDVHDAFNSRGKWADRQNKSHRPDFCLPKTPACQNKLFGGWSKDKTLRDLEELEKSFVITQGDIE